MIQSMLGKNLEIIMLPKETKHKMCDSINMKYTEQLNPQRQKVDQCIAEARKESGNIFGEILKIFRNYAMEVHASFCEYIKYQTCTFQNVNFMIMYMNYIPNKIFYICTAIQ